MLTDTSKMLDAETDPNTSRSLFQITCRRTSSVGRTSVVLSAGIPVAVLAKAN